MDLREQATYSPLRRKESVTTRLQTDFKVPHTFIFWQVCFIWQLNQTSPKEPFLAESEGCSVELTTTAQQNPMTYPMTAPLPLQEQNMGRLSLWRATGAVTMPGASWKATALKFAQKSTRGT